MANKRLRFMILESDHFQRLSIEKMLNQLGYYGVTGMGSTAEAVSALRYARQVFDLVIANADLVGGFDIGFDEYCQGNPYVRHSLVYESPESVFKPVLLATPRKIQTTLLRPPDSLSIRYLMQLVECTDTLKLKVWDV
jgi:hypothetical protein